MISPAPSSFKRGFAPSSFKRGFAPSSFKRGFAPLWILLVLAAAGATVYSGKAVADKYYTQAKRDSVAIEELLKQSPSYLDSNKLADSKVDGPVVGIVTLPDGSYSAYQINKADISTSKSGKISYISNAEIEFLTGDVGTGMFDGGKITPFYLKTGDTADATIVSRMTALLTATNGQSYPIKIYEGRVQNGKLVGNFKAQTYSSGHVIIGKFTDKGTLSAVSVSLGAERLSDSLAAVVPKALEMFRKTPPSTGQPTDTEEEASFFSLEEGAGLVGELDVLKGTLTDKEPFVAVGDEDQYWRGDKTWQDLDSDAVGLGDVENTALSTWEGSTDLVELGSVSTGSWKATAIADDYISSASEWNSHMTDDDLHLNIPTQSGQAGKILATNGSALTWVTNATGSAWGQITGTLANQVDLSDALNNKEPLLAVGATSQYFRGDKTWQNFDKAAIGLGNVENTAVSTWVGSSNITTVGTLTAGTLSTGVNINFANTTETGTASIDISGNSATATSSTTAGTATNFSGSLTGDVSGTQSATSVDKIKGVAVGTATASSGNLLIGSGSQWVTQALSNDATLNSSGVLTLKSVGTAATYGSATQVPVITTDTQGRVSSVTNTTITGLTTSNLSGTAGITNAQLQNNSISVNATAGTGISVTGSPVSLGGTLTLAGTNAAYVTKGVASFNSTNFSVTTGAVNTVQNINTTASPTFSSMNLANTSNQMILGVTNTTTLSAAAPAANRVVTIPALVTNASDTFVFLNEAQSLTNKTILAGSNTISGLTNSNLSGTAGITDANLATVSTSNKVSGSAVQLGTGGGITNNTGISLLTSCSSSQVLKWNGSAWACAADDTGGAPALNADGGLVISSGISMLRTCSDGQMLKWTAAGGWACASDNTGGGAPTILEADGGPSIASVVALEFGPPAASSEEFVVTDQTGGVARVRTGTKVVLTDAAQALTNKTIVAGSNTISGIVNANLSGTAGITDANLATVTTANKVSGSAVQLSATGGLENDTGLSLLTSCSASQVLVWNSGTSTWECGSPSVSINGIAAASGASTINNADYAQVWNWALTTAAKTAFTFGENTAATNGAGAQYILNVNTLPTSTAAPLTVLAQNNTIIDTTAAGGLTLGSQTAGQAVNIYSGEGALNLGSDANAKTVTVGTTTGASALNMYAGTGNFILDGVGGTTYTIGASTTSGTVTLGGTAQSGTANMFAGTGGLSINLGTGAASNTITIGNNTTATAVAINSGTGNITNQTPNSYGTVFKTTTANNDTIRVSPGLNGGAGSFQGTLTSLDLTAARVWSMQDSTGIIPLATAANSLFFTTTGNTALTLPTSGTVTALGNTSTGTGALVLATSPTLTTPNIGAATATTVNGLSLTANATGFSIAGGTSSKTLTVNNTLTLAAGADGETYTFPATGGAVTVLGNSTTGSGSLVLATAPTLTTPVLGIATATSINRVTFTQPATGSTLTILEGKTLTANNSITIAGIDSKTLTVNNSLTLTGADSKALNIGSNNLTFTTTGDTSLTLPTVGTVATTSQLHTQNTDTSTTSANFTVGSSSTHDQLALVSVAKGATSFLGNITSSDLTVERTWSLQDNTGIIPLSTGGNTMFFTTTGATNVTLPTSGTLLATESDTLDTVSGRGATTSNALTLNGGITTATTTALTLDSGTTGAVNLGANANAKTITIGNTTGATTVNINSGSGNINLVAGSTASSGKVQIGNSATATPDLLVLDNGTADPTGLNGGMYYNTSTGKFRCFQNSTWQNCVGTGSDLQMSTTTLNATTLAATTTFIGTVSVTPSTTTGDVYVYLDLWTNSLNNANQTVSTEIRTGTANCAGTLLATGTAALTSANNSNGPNVFAAYLAIDPGTTAQNYAFCAYTGTASGTSAGGLGTAMVIDTGADLAEIYTTFDASISAGDVVSLDANLQAGVKKSTTSYDQNVLGIISTKPGLVIGNVTKEGVNALPVALSGRVPVKVSTENGAIVSGDYLTSSSIPGVAMKATKASIIIGTAMTSFDGNGIGQVLTFVKNGSYFGQIADKSLTSDAILAKLLADNLQYSSVNLSEIVTDRVVAGLELVTPKIITSEIFADTLTVKSITAEKINATQIEGLTILADELATNKIGALIDFKLAQQSSGSVNTSGEQTEDTNIPTGEIDAVGNISFAKGTTAISGILKVNKSAEILLDMKVYGQFLAKGGLIVEGPAKFEAKTIFEDLAQFISAVIFKGEVTFEGRPTFNADTAGSVALKKGTDKVKVAFEDEYKYSPKVVITLEVTNTDATDGVFDAEYQYVVTAKDTKGFEIALNKDAKQTLVFSWVAIATSKDTTPLIEIEEEMSSQVEESTATVSAAETGAAADLETTGTTVNADTAVTDTPPAVDTTTPNEPLTDQLVVTEPVSTTVSTTTGE